MSYDIEPGQCSARPSAGASNGGFFSFLSRSASAAEPFGDSVGCAPTALFYLGVSIGALVALAALVAWFSKEKPLRQFSIKGNNFIITGGSSGIGLATAKQLARAGAGAIVIMARGKNAEDFEAACESIRKENQKTVVHGVKCDVSSKDAIATGCQQAITLLDGRVNALICSAGASLPKVFAALTPEDLENQVRINYLGSAWVVQACLPAMIRSSLSVPGTPAPASSSVSTPLNPGSSTRPVFPGRIILVSSMAGLSGVAGYTSYSASKFAVRGFGESLHMELNEPYGISVSVCCPPDVDTPMYAAENEIKPKECKLISEGSGLFTADNIAFDIVSGLKSWKFLINTGFDGVLSSLLCAGTAPAHSIIFELVGFSFLGLIRTISLVYRWSYNSIVAKVHRERLDGKLKDFGSEALSKILKE